MKLAILLASILTSVFFYVAPQSATACARNLNQPAEAMAWIWCNSTWVNFYWDAYSMDESDWNGDRGFSNACDTTKPLGRTMNAIEVVNYAMPVDPTRTDDFSGNFFHWAGNFTMDAIDELDSVCSESAIANTVWGPVVDNYTELYTPFYYDANIVTRASALVHEARHADWCGHSGNDGSNPCPARNSSCDESTGFNGEDACAGFLSTSGQGANGYEVNWLWWYTVEADSNHNSTTMRNRARNEANRILNTMFDIMPCFNITSTGAVVTTC